MDLACDVCDRSFEAQRSDAKYCSPKCRTMAHRVRRGEAIDPKTRRRAPLRPQVQRALIELDKAVRRLERLSGDDRFSGAWDAFESAQLRSARFRLADLDTYQPPGA